MQQNNNLFQENCQRSQNKQALYSEWLKASNEKNQLTNTIAQMQSHINKLETQIKQLSSQSNIVKIVEKTPPLNQGEYWTGKEELAREMGKK